MRFDYDSPTAAAALEALKNGEIDCMFPANLTSFDGEEMGIVKDIDDSDVVSTAK